MLCREGGKVPATVGDVLIKAHGVLPKIANRVIHGNPTNPFRATAVRYGTPSAGSFLGVLFRCLAGTTRFQGSRRPETLPQVPTAVRSSPKNPHYFIHPGCSPLLRFARWSRLDSQLYTQTPIFLLLLLNICSSALHPASASPALLQALCHGPSRSSTNIHDVTAVLTLSFLPVSDSSTSPNHSHASSTIPPPLPHPFDTPLRRNTLRL